ncbi:hypothetical protein SAMN05421676_101243 [Salinibacillus kushneri]|uniref:Uncharacterized protein n=1 Tax=Salinibacillus kushneri TaxID=237682 RepID=A0A1H9YPF1_9BACI|nr:hypothetical protein [Salinibacillus kushneri]SES70926.1 hypothetical protein SAMN05421676_101243 [Salinibacillus kushneri]
MEIMKKAMLLSFLGILVVFITIGCRSITIPGENGEEMEIDMKDASDGNVDVSMKESDGNEERFEVSSDGETATISSSDGESSFNSQSGENLTLPESFPDDFPLPSDANVISVSEMSDHTKSGGEIDSITYLFEGDMERAYDELKTYAEANGYTIMAETQIDGMYTIQSEKEKGYFSGSLIPDTENETQITANIQIGAPK